MHTQKTDGQPLSSQSIFLLIASGLSGVITGSIGYLIGQYFYVLFLFPFILLIIGITLYLPILKYLKTSKSLYNGLCGFIMGLTIFASFHYVEYSLFRAKAIQAARLAHGMSENAASNSVDVFLKKEAGLAGFLGFMKYQESQDQSFVYYFDEERRRSNSIVIILHGATTWLYLAGEGIVLSGGLFLFSSLAMKIPWMLPRDRI